MMCSKVFLSEALKYTLTTSWAAGYRNHYVAQNSLDGDTTLMTIRLILSERVQLRRRPVINSLLGTMKSLRSQFVTVVARV